MRTTIDVPDDLLRSAKAEAAARGETLKELLTRALSHELGTPAVQHPRGRVRLPLVGSTRPGAVDLTNAEIEAILAAEDAERPGTR